MPAGPRAGLDSAALAGGADPSHVWAAASTSTSRRWRDCEGLGGSAPEAVVRLSRSARFRDWSRPLPFADAGFNAVAGNSVFTQMNGRNQFFYPGVFRRATRAGAMLFPAVSGARVLERAESGSIIAAMLASPTSGLAAARAALDAGPGFCFLRQHGDPASSRSNYGVTSISQACIARNWSRYFELQDVVRGAIHNFQDIVGLRRRDDSAVPEPIRRHRPSIRQRINCLRRFRRGLR